MQLPQATSLPKFSWAVNPNGDSPIHLCDEMMYSSRPQHVSSMEVVIWSGFVQNISKMFEIFCSTSSPKDIFVKRVVHWDKHVEQNLV